MSATTIPPRGRRGCLAGIYRIINTKTREFYVGKAVDVGYRFNSHLRLLSKGSHHCKKLQESFDRYGLAAFRFEIIQACKENELYETERFWIRNLKPVFNSECSSEIWEQGIPVRSPTTRAKIAQCASEKKAAELKAKLRHAIGRKRWRTAILRHRSKFTWDKIAKSRRVSNTTIYKDLLIVDRRCKQILGISAAEYFV